MQFFAWAKLKKCAQSSTAPTTGGATSAGFKGQKGTMDSHSAGLIEEIKRAFSMVRNSRGWAKFIEIHQLILQGYSENGSEANYAGLFHGIKLTATHTTKTPTTGHMVTLQLFAPGAQNPREMVVMYSED